MKIDGVMCSFLSCSIITFLRGVIVLDWVHGGLLCCGSLYALLAFVSVVSFVVREIWRWEGFAKRLMVYFRNSRCVIWSNIVVSALVLFEFYKIVNVVFWQITCELIQDIWKFLWGKYWTFLPISPIEIWIRPTVYNTIHYTKH